jgi:hypothetical protein
MYGPSIGYTFSLGPYSNFVLPLDAIFFTVLRLNVYFFATDRWLSPLSKAKRTFFIVSTISISLYPPNQVLGDSLHLL